MTYRTAHDPRPAGHIARLVGASLAGVFAGGIVAALPLPDHWPAGPGDLGPHAMAAVAASLACGGWMLVRDHRRALAAARRDADTGLGTSAAFRHDLEAAVAGSVHGRRPLVLALVAPDALADVARYEGRRAADALLISAGAALRRPALRDGAVEAYRVGALAFGVILDATTLDEAFSMAEAVTRRLTEQAAGLRASVGLAVLDQVRTPDAGTLLIAADAALDQARALGGCRVVVAAAEGSGRRWVTAPG